MTCGLLAMGTGQISKSDFVTDKHRMYGWYPKQYVGDMRII